MGLRFSIGLPGPFSYSVPLTGGRKRRRSSPAPRRHSRACDNGNAANCRRCQEDADAGRAALGCLGVVAALFVIGLVVAYWRWVLPALVLIGAIAAYRPLARWFQARTDAQAAAIAEYEAEAQQRAERAAADPMAEVERVISQGPETDDDLGWMDRMSIRQCESLARDYDKRAAETTNPERAAKLRRKAVAERVQADKYRAEARATH